MPRKTSKKGPSQRRASAADERSKSTAEKALSKGRPKAANTRPPSKRAAPIKIERATPIVDLGSVWGHIGILSPIEFRVSFIRPDDLLVCDFIFDNMQLVGNDPKKLVRRKLAPSTLIVELPPQSFGEEAFLEPTGPVTEKFDESSALAKPKNVATSGDPVGDLPSAKVRMAGRSRIAFYMPGDESELDFTLEAILDACRRWPMRLDSNAASEPDFLLLGALKELNADWLTTAAAMANWSMSARPLIDALGGGIAVEKPLAEAARRVAKQAGNWLSKGTRKDAETAIHRAMNDELDALAARYAPLQDSNRRATALAALSLMTSEKFAESKGLELTTETFKKLSFLSVVLAPHEPSPLVTALELPYRVILSPIPRSNWWHETKPVTRHGRTELWHTRLTSTTDGVGPDVPTKVRAIWSPDYPMKQEDIIDIITVVNSTPPVPFRMSLDALDRVMLVKLMADFTDKTPLFFPRASHSNRLALSSLGALLDVEGNWQHLPEGVGLEQWRHLATLGRDHYVRVVYRGFLCTFGHAASLIKVTERKFESLPGTKNRVAVLRQRFFIVVREPVKHYSGTGHDSHGNNFPFTSVEILTRVTPNLLDPGNLACRLKEPGTNPDASNDAIYGKFGGQMPHRTCFWPLIGPDNNFMFQIAATDLSGRRVTFAMPLLFVGKEANEKAPVKKDEPSVIDEIIKRYDLEFYRPRRSASMGNAAICYAPENPAADPQKEKKGDPRLPTADMTFDAAGVHGVSTKEPQFYPEVQDARVGIAAIQRLLQQPNATCEVAYPEVYKSGGFGAANKGEVFLKLLAPFDLEFGNSVKSDAIGGLASPSMSIQGLSRIIGPVAAKPDPDIEKALDKVINNEFNPEDFFKGAKILGGVELYRILKTASALGGPDVPRLLSKQLPDKIEASFDWATDINTSDPLGLFVPNAGGQTKLEMHGVVSSPIATPSATTFTATASIVNFKVNLFGFVTVWFDNLKFSAKTGSKPDVAVDLHPGDDAIAFGGPLEFVNELRRIIPSNGFSDPPSLSVTPSGISASYSISMPTLAVGIFALENVSLGAGFSLPFDAKPAEVRFNFAERQSPFSLTVSLLGGGGFFAIGVGTEGVREIEAALEFGASLSIDLGVASGMVEIKAGVYFHWLTNSVELAGYVRLHGEVSVLGLISASLTFNLQLAYLKENGHSVVWGEATLEVEIDILFFSFSVSVKCRREFGGSSGDPKFIELIPDQSTWTSYCEAFALEA